MLVGVRNVQTRNNKYKQKDHLMTIHFLIPSQTFAERSVVEEQYLIYLFFMTFAYIRSVSCVMFRIVFLFFFVFFLACWQ